MSESSGLEELFRAIELAQVTRVKEILQKDPRLASSVIPTGHTALHAVAQYGRPEMIEVLEGFGAPLDAKELLAGETPLHIAVRTNQAGVVLGLLAAGANVDSRDANQWTPLHSAAYDGNIAIIDLLLGYRADLNAKEQTGSTPTAAAVLNNQIAAARYLRDRGGQTHVWKGA